MTISYRVLAAALFFLTAGLSASAATLDDVKTRGHLVCGVEFETQGFAIRNDEGRWTGLHVDFCRAVAAAIFLDPEKVEFYPVDRGKSVGLLRSGMVDILSSHSHWSMTKEAENGVRFVGVTYFDGQGFMVPRNLGIASALELSGISICAQNRQQAKTAVSTYFDANKMPFKISLFDRSEDGLQAYLEGHCNALSSDLSHLANQRRQLTKPADHLLLPEIISKKPQGPFVRQDDMSWYNLVRSVLFVLINAEELGVGLANFTEMQASKNADVRLLLGLDGHLGDSLNLGKEWARKVISTVGNYGEIFDRHFGANTKLNIDRGLNRLWSRGGMMFAPPMR